MSFWTENPCAPRWTSFLESWWNTFPPRLLCTQPWRPPLTPVASLRLREGRVEDARAVIEFWNRFYSTSASSKCFFPVDLFCQRVLKGTWDVYVVVHEVTGEIVGTITRRWMKQVVWDEAVFPRAGFIEYFCVHPAWRKKGVGNWLLGTLHHTAMVRTQPCPPHFFLWEGLNVRTQSFCTGFFYSKRGRATGNLRIASKEEIAQWWPTQQRGTLFNKELPLDEITVYCVKGGYLAIWNTFHRSTPDGAHIGVILGQPAEDSIQQVSEQGGYGILLRTSSASEGGWTMDSPYQWIAYNVQSRSLLHAFPLFAL